MAQTVLLLWEDWPSIDLQHEHELFLMKTEKLIIEWQWSILLPMIAAEKLFSPEKMQFLDNKENKLLNSDLNLISTISTKILVL